MYRTLEPKEVETTTLTKLPVSETGIETETDKSVGKGWQDEGGLDSLQQFLNEAGKFMPNPMAMMSAREELEQRKDINSRR